MNTIANIPATENESFMQSELLCGVARHKYCDDVPIAEGELNISV